MNRSLSAATPWLSLPVVLLASSCVATIGELDDSYASDTSSDLVATRVALDFEVGGFRCPGGVAVCPRSAEQCVCQTEQDHLNAVRVLPGGAVEGHYLVMGSDSRRGEVEAMGNRLAVNINELNADWETGAAARADAMMAWARRQFPGGVPQWFLLNEISRGAWTDTTERGARYRRYVGEIARLLSEVHGRKVIVFSPFYRPGWDGRALYRDAWATIGRYAYIGVENYMSGASIRAHGFSETYCRAHYLQSVTAYVALGVPRNRLMLTEHFGHTLPGTAWGRAGVSLEDWLHAIRVRTRAQRSIAVAGYIGYAWAWNKDGRPSGDRTASMDAYFGVGARRVSRPVAVPRAPAGASDPAFDGAAASEPEHAPDVDDGIADPGTDPATDPAADAAADPATDPGTDPATDPGTDPATDPAAEPAPTSEPACDPPNTIAIGDRCVPSCGAAGGNTCADVGASACAGLPLFESYDCGACCARPVEAATCAPRTCGAEYNDSCDGALDGCGGTLSCGDTCGAGLNCAPSGVCKRALAQPCAGPGQCASNRCSWTTTPGSAARCCHDAGQWCDSDLKCCGSLVCRGSRCVAP